VIHPLGSGGFVISSRRVWRPGVYENARVARWAFQFADEELATLWDGSHGLPIRHDDLKRLADRRRLPS